VPADANAGAAAPPATPIVVVSKRAIVQRGAQTSVWVVTNGIAATRNVTLGPERLDQVEVKSGLAPGEAVIINAPDTVLDHGHVRVRGA
jgi:hypothetical protein